MLVPLPLYRSENWSFVTNQHERRTERTEVNFLLSVLGYIQLFSMAQQPLLGQGFHHNR
jgi:hypothetical protein